MDLVSAFIIFAASMAGVLYLGHDMLWAVIIGFIGFFIVGLKRGFKFKYLLKLSLRGAKGSLIVAQFMLIIGVLTGLWRISGTFALLTFWGLKLINPKFFILAAFALSCLISYAIGTSFGTVSTIGAALLMLARSSGLQASHTLELLTAGAVMSGIYFGDRASPASSCANLVASLTHTDLYKNIKLMMRTAFIPLLITIILYALLSLNHPLDNLNSSMLKSLEANFNLTPWAIIPAVLMLVLPLFNIKILKVFILSIAAAFICAVTFQGESFYNTLHCAVFGFQANNSVMELFNGGGLMSMVSVSLVLLVSGTYSAILGDTNMLDNLQHNIIKLADKIGMFPVTLTAGVLADAAFCNQTIGVMITNQLMAKPYELKNLPPQALAIDISNSAVIAAGLIPWCLGCSVPLAVMNISPSCLIYAFYLYLLPLCCVIFKNKIKLI
ncbi:MAG: sodium:proton antiporter [Synergistaceae bacterium]|nr:sodium:proton antiporter [Synergistaceae bacterium]